MSTDKSYTKIPNEIIEAAIRSNLSTLEWTALMYVIRKTYGWGKESDTISVRKMAKDTGHDFRAMQRAVSKLEESKVLLIQKGNTKINVMRVRNPDKWQKMTVTRPSELTVRRPPTKERKKTKETIQKKESLRLIIFPKMKNRKSPMNRHVNGGGLIEGAYL